MKTMEHLTSEQELANRMEITYLSQILRFTQDDNVFLSC
jgi:hypothetical protein